MDDLAKRLFFKGATQSVDGDIGLEFVGLVLSVSSLIACRSHRFLADALSKLLLLLLLFGVEKPIIDDELEVGVVAPLCPGVLTLRRIYCCGKLSSPDVGELYHSDMSAWNKTKNKDDVLE
jgi:hypothetical protein